MITLRWMAAADLTAVEDATELFDYRVRADWAQRFLDQPHHHLCIAYDDGAPAGFVSGVEMTHPDKGTEMFLYELGVDEQFRGKGIGRALVEALAARAKDRGCYGMWVLTEEDNAAARATYGSAGGGDDSPQLMLTWRLDRAHQTFGGSGA